MPVVAVAAAVVAVTVAVEVGTTFAIIAAVGATIGAIGAVTGNKGLMIAGGVIGAIGGIGALASSAGIFGSAASSLSEVAAGTTAAETASPFGAASGIDSEISQWSSYGADAASGSLSGASTVGAASPTVDNTLDVVNTVSGNVNTTTEPLASVSANAGGPDVMPQAATDTGVPNTQMAGQEMVDTNGAVIQGDTVPDPTTAAGAATPKAPAAPGVAPSGTPADTTGSILGGGQGVPGDTVTGAPSAGTTVTGAPLSNGTGITITRGGSVVPASGTAPLQASGSSSIWGDIMNTLGKPGVGTLASGVVQAGMSFLGGATNGLTPAQIAALKAQAAANNAAANLAKMQQANMSAPLPVATRSPPVTGAPTGLINQPPPKVNAMGAPA